MLCRSLGYHNALSADTNSEYGPGNHSIVLDKVGCLGNESFIQVCTHYITIFQLLFSYPNLSRTVHTPPGGTCPPAAPLHRSQVSGVTGLPVPSDWPRGRTAGW